MTGEIEHATRLQPPALLVETRADGPVADVTIGSGAKRNALSGVGWSEVEERIRELGETDPCG